MSQISAVNESRGCYVRLIEIKTCDLFNQKGKIGLHCKMSMFRLWENYTGILKYEVLEKW